MRCCVSERKGTGLCPVSVSPRDLPNLPFPVLEDKLQEVSVLRECLSKTSSGKLVSLEASPLLPFPSLYPPAGDSIVLPGRGEKFSPARESVCCLPPTPAASAGGQHMAKGDRRCSVAWCGFGLLFSMDLKHLISYCLLETLEFYGLSNPCG